MHRTDAIVAWAGGEPVGAMVIGVGLIAVCIVGPLVHHMFRSYDTPKPEDVYKKFRIH